MTCTTGTWSECVGTRVQRVAAPGASRLLALGQSQACGAADICNPYCNQVEDNATGLVVDPADDVQVVNDGVTLKQVEGGSVGAVCTALTITPGNTTLNLTQLAPLAPSSLQFSAAVSPPGCYPGQLEVLWAIDRFDVATISTTGLVNLVSALAGPIKVTAYAGSLSATVTLTVTLNVIDTSAISSTLWSLFQATSSSYNDTGLTALYPYANTVFPLGLGAPLIQWKDTNNLAAQAVKISLRYPATGTPSFQWSQVVPGNSAIWLNPPTNTVPLAAGPRATIPESVWDTFEQVAKGGTGAYVIQRLTTHVGVPLTRMGTELVTPIKFATGQLKGTVYYQSYGTNLVANYSSTYQGSSAQQYARADRKFGAATLSISPGATYPSVTAGYTSSNDGGGCRVCHTASADGTRLVTNLHSTEGDRISSLFRLGTDAASGGIKMVAPNGTFAVAGGLYAWPAIYPDGSFLFSNAGPGPDHTGSTPPGGLEGSANTDKQNRLFSLDTSVALLGKDISPTTTGYPTTLRAATPVFSPVGNKLAFNHYAGAVTVGSGASAVTYTGDKRSLGMMDFDKTTKQFTNFRRLVTETTNCSGTYSSTTSDPCTIVWPTFLPNNTGLVYERELFNNGRVSGANNKDFGGTRAGCEHATNACSSDGTRAELWWTSLDSTPTARRLDAANGRNSSGTVILPTLDSTQHTLANEGVLNYEPTVNPQPVGGYYWVAFTSRRLYGNVATMNPWWSDPRYKALAGSQGPTPKKIWVAAISENPAENTDPSAPAFYLPGQEYLAGNSKAYWVLDKCKTAASTRSTATECESDLDCCNAPTQSVCSLQTPIANPAKRHCVPTDASSCIADNAATQCFSDAQCCGFATGSRCANGTCQVPPTLMLYQPGTFTRDFASDCTEGKHPVWQFFEWQADLPAGTSITFTAYTADNTTDLATAVAVPAGVALPPSTTTWTNDGTNINDQLTTLDQFSQEYLRVTANLTPSTDELSAPVLKNWRVVYDCIDGE